MQADAKPGAGDELHRLERAILALAKRVYLRPHRPMPTPTSLNRAGYAVMSRLEGCGDVRLSDLAGLLDLDLSTVSRQVKILETAGLVERTPDPADRRAALLVLSTAGRRVLEAQRAERHLLLERAMRTWSAEERATLTTLVERLALALGTPPPPPPQQTHLREVRA